MIKQKALRFSCAFLILTASSAGHANVGSRLVGYGAKAQSMGGAGVAFPQDAIAAANNPAGMALVGNRVDADIHMVYADADVEFLSSSNRHEGNIFLAVPELGVNYQLTPNLTIGLSTAASGMAFKFEDPILPIPGLQRNKFSVRQVDFLPTVAYRFDNGLALGLSFLYAVQHSSLQGVPGPFPGGQNPDYGTEKSYGTAWKAGGLWTINERLAFGASYTPKVNMSKLSGYKDDLLSSAGGSIDSPEQYTVGVSFKLADRWAAALDYQHLAWDKVDVYSDMFGWRDQNVVKAGVSYDLSDDWVLRGGMSHARLHTTSKYAAPNFLLIGINSTAFTVGATRKISASSELNFALEYDYGDPLDGSGPSEGTKIDANYYEFTVGYGWRF